MDDSDIRCNNSWTGYGHERQEATACEPQHSCYSGLRCWHCPRASKSRSGLLNFPCKPLVLAIGIYYGSLLGGATILAYLFEGALGLPVFQSGSGIAYMVGPTGGFLLGFFLAAVVIGYCTERGMLNRLPTTIAALLLAEAAIHILGVAWLGILFGPAKSIAFGLTPFLTGEALKIGLLLAFVLAIRRVMR